MKKVLTVLVAVALVVSVGLMGCAKKAANASEAIQTAQTKETVQQKVDYLVGQANAFVSSKEFDEAIKAAQYILGNLDKESTAAQSIIEKAKEEMKKAAMQAAEDVKKKIGSF